MTAKAARIRRIVSLLPSATEILFALGLGESVVGVSHECDEPIAARRLPRVTRSNVNAAASSLGIDDEVRASLASGRAIYELDEAAIAQLEPDLIVTQAQCDVCAVRLADVQALVEHSPDLQRTKLVALNPQSLDDVLADVQRLAAVTGAIDAGERLVEQMHERIDAVRHAVEGRMRPRVACIEWTEPLMFAGNWVPELIELAGGESGLAAAGKHSPYGTWEALTAYNPQVIVVTPCGFDLERSWQEVPALVARQGWNELAAVREGRVYVVDGNAYFNRSGPRLIDTLEILAHLVHPDAVLVRECNPPRWRKWTGERPA